MYDICAQRCDLKIRKEKDIRWSMLKEISVRHLCPNIVTWKSAKMKDIGWFMLKEISVRHLCPNMWPENLQKWRTFVGLYVNGNQCKTFVLKDVTWKSEKRMTYIRWSMLKEISVRHLCPICDLKICKNEGHSLVYMLMEISVWHLCSKMWPENQKREGHSLVYVKGNQCKTFVSKYVTWKSAKMKDIGWFMLKEISVRHLCPKMWPENQTREGHSLVYMLKEKMKSV